VELTFVLGGTRSGKSRFAGRRAAALGGNEVTYVATARRGDAELDRRIAAHRRARPAVWTTVETGSDLAQTLASVAARHVVLLDSLTLWVAACLDEGVEVRSAWAAAEAQLTARERPVIVVSDEVGLGVIPANELARRFCDEIGELHQRVAAQASTVAFMVAGLPVVVKGTF
jgi:adenosylcobinamide kinase / adenosylcobinamide-phosphate guanylyltransferase